MYQEHIQKSINIMLKLILNIIFYYLPLYPHIPNIISPMSES